MSITGDACATTCHFTPSAADAFVVFSIQAICSAPSISRSGDARCASRSSRSDRNVRSKSLPRHRAGARSLFATQRAIVPLAFANTFPPGFPAGSVLASSRVSNITTLATSPKCATRLYRRLASGSSFGSPVLARGSRVGSHSWNARIAARRRAT